jgi:hypothetical protein
MKKLILAAVVMKLVFMLWTAEPGQISSLFNKRFQRTSTVEAVGNDNY